MGVSLVLHWYPAATATSIQIEDVLHNHIISNIGGKLVLPWKMDCEQFAAIPNLSAISGKTFQLIHTSENESLSFAVTDQMGIIVSERSFDTILTKISDCYQPNKLTRIEAKGKKYEIGDFAIKVGSVFLGPSFKCNVIEVEYKPSSYTKDTVPLVREFLQIICSNIVPIPENFGQIGMARDGNFYQLSDTIVQYVRLFNECRRVNPAISLS